MAYSDLISARVAADEAAHSLVGVRGRDNLDSLDGDRTCHGSVAYTSPDYVSTHPEHWSGVPLLVPVVEAETLHLAVLVDVLTADVSMRLRVESALGSAVTASAGAGQVVALSCPVPFARASGRVWRAQLEIQSTISETEVTIPPVRRLGVLSLTTDYDVSLATGRRHISLDLSGIDADGSLGLGTYHVGHVQDVDSDGESPLDANRLYVWPELSPEAVAGALNTTAQQSAYELGRARIHGMSWWYAGGAVSPPSADLYHATELASASSARGLASYAAGMARRTMHAWPAAPTSVGFVGRLSADVYASAPVSVQRKYVGAYRYHGLVAARGSLAASVAPIARNWTDDTTVTPAPSPIDVDSAQVRQSPEQADGLLMLRAHTLALSWGGGDLLYAGPEQPDLFRLRLVEADYTGTLPDVSDDWSLDVRLLRSSGSGSLLSAAGLVTEFVDVTSAADEGYGITPGRDARAAPWQTVTDRIGEIYTDRRRVLVHASSPVTGDRALAISQRTTESYPSTADRRGTLRVSGDVGSQDLRMSLVGRDQTVKIEIYTTAGSLVQTVETDTETDAIGYSEIVVSSSLTANTTYEWRLFAEASKVSSDAALYSVTLTEVA